MQVLVISDLYPNPTSAISGIFVQKQVESLRQYCDQTIVAPVRMFPHLRLWKNILNPHQLILDWSNWIEGLRSIPAYSDKDNIPIYFPRYTSLPKQIFQGTWGFFAYAHFHKDLRRIHAKKHIQLIHAHYASPSGVVAILSKRWMKIPVVLSVHGADITYTAKQNQMSAAIIRWVFDNVDSIITNSSWTMQKIIQYGGDRNKIKIVRLGGDISPSTGLTRSYPNSAEGFNILSVGYLKRSKGQYFVIQAVRRLVDMGYRIKYRIVGDGPDFENLTKLVADLNLGEYVSFEGAIPHDKIGEYYQVCDLFVLPSWNEAFGIVYIEALGFGKPVIGCKGSGGPEDLKSLGDCIELIRPGDLDSLVQSIKHLINNPDRRRFMGVIGQKIVTENYTWKKNAADTYAIYKQLLTRSHF